MPGGLTSVVVARLDSIAVGDANIEIRRLENVAVVRAVAGSELLGVGPLVTLGVIHIQPDGRIVYTVHNAYYLIFGIFGLVGLASLLWLVGGVTVVGLLALRRAGPGDAALLFGLCVGMVRGLLSSWTQMDLTNVTGILVMSLCAGGIIAIATHERVSQVQL